MSVLLETTFGDLTVDLDVDGSPALARNLLKLAAARLYTGTLVYNVVPGKYCQLGDPKGDGTGGCSIHGLIDAYRNHDGASPSSKPPDVTASRRRFLSSSSGRELRPSELGRKGLVIAMEMGGVANTVGSQFLITLGDDNGLSDTVPDELTAAMMDPAELASRPRYLSLGRVAEDGDGVLDKLSRVYCDDDGRPFADVRVGRCLVVHDPYDDPDGMDGLLAKRGVAEAPARDEYADLAEGRPVPPSSPSYSRPPEEAVPVRIAADESTLFATAGWDDLDDDGEEDPAERARRLEFEAKREEEHRKRQDSSRAVMLEMLGDRPDADVEAPDDVLFVCKLNPLTNDEDLELIFARFDEGAKAEIIRDPDTGASLHYAFVEFRSKEACNEAYLKMDNALVDDRRIRVDFSQSVSHIWDRYNRRYRRGDRRGMGMSFGPGRGGRGSGGGRTGGRGGGGRGLGPGGRGPPRRDDGGRPDRRGPDHRGPDRRGDDRSRGDHRDGRGDDRSRGDRRDGRGDRGGGDRDGGYDDFGRAVRPPGGGGGRDRGHDERRPRNDRGEDPRRPRNDRSRDDGPRRRGGGQDDRRDDGPRRRDSERDDRARDDGQRRRDGDRDDRARGGGRRGSSGERRRRRSRSRSDGRDGRRRRDERRSGSASSDSASSGGRRREREHGRRRKSRHKSSKRSGRRRHDSRSRSRDGGGGGRRHGKKRRRRSSSRDRSRS